MELPASVELGRFLRKLKEDGYTIYLVGSVGSIPAIAATLSLWKIVEPHRQYIDYIRAASGSGIPLSLAASGMTSAEIRETLLGLKIKDIVEDIGFFAENNQGEGILGMLRDLKDYYLRWIRAASIIINHMVDHRIGIVRGDNIKRLLEKTLRTNTFGNTSPPLEVVATLVKGSKTYIFSKETTPDIPISDA